jgi:hypothetical protein
MLTFRVGDAHKYKIQYCAETCRLPHISSLNVTAKITVSNPSVRNGKCVLNRPDRDNSASEFFTTDPGRILIRSQTDSRLTRFPSWGRNGNIIFQ